MRLCVFLITNSIVKFCDYFFSTHPMLLFNRFITSLRQGFNFNTFCVIIQLIVVTEVL